VDAIGFAPQGEFKYNLTALIPPDEITSHVFWIPFSAAAFTIEGKAHGIQQHGFPRSRGTMDKKKGAVLQAGKVYFMGAYKWSKGSQLQAYWFHIYAPLS
jgi:hypothetical protein